MKQTLLTLIALVFCMSLNAQERYLDEIFTEVEMVSDVTYGQNWDYSGNFVDLKADIFTPVGDTTTQRPMMILMHAGSFLPQLLLPLGTKEDIYLQEMATQFAKRGWTVASISYRLGWNPFADDVDIRKGTIISAVYRAMQDLKTATRFFRRSVDMEGNPYGIDPTRIAAGGTNSGGYVALAAISIDREEELLLDKFLDSNFLPVVDIDALGGIEGDNGGAETSNYQWGEYSSELGMCLNMGGAIGDISWYEAGEVPVVSFHGVLDSNTPYDTDIVIVSTNGEPVVEVSGTRDIHIKADQLGNNDLFKSLNDPYSQAARTNFEPEGAEGEGAFLFRNYSFEPWGFYNFCDSPLNTLVDDDPNTEYCSSSLQFNNLSGTVEQYITNEIVAAPFIDTIMNYFAPRAVLAMQLEGYDELSSTQSIQQANAFVQVFPNPSNGVFTFEGQTSNLIQKVSIRDIAGRLVSETNGVLQNSIRLDLSQETAGIYLAEITLNDGTSVAQKLMLK